MGEAAMVMKNDVNLERVRPEVMREVLEKFGFNVGMDPTPLELVEKLMKYLGTQQSEQLQCDECDGWSPRTLDVCPYCGEGGVNGVVESLELAPASIEVPSTRKVEAFDAPSRCELEEVDVLDVPPSSKVPSTVEELAVIVGAEEDAKAAEKTKKKPRAKKEKLVASSSEPVEALVVVERAPSNDEVELNRAVARIHDLKGLAAHGQWLIGREIHNIFTPPVNPTTGRVLVNPKTGRALEPIYKARIGDGGKPKYRNFEEFVDAELHMSSKSAYRHMDVARKYDEATVRQLGYSKLELSLKVSEENREEIVEKIKAGASARDVMKDVKKIREEGIVLKDAGRVKTPWSRDIPSVEKAKRPKKEPELKSFSEDQITTVVVLKRHNVPLFHKDDKGKRAKRLGDQPCGYLDLANRVTAKILVRANVDGELEAVFTFKRAPE